MTNTSHYWANAHSSFSIHSADRGVGPGTPVSRLSWFFAPFSEIAGMTIVTISKLPTAGCRRLRAAGRIVIQACSRQLRSDSGEQYAQLGRLRLGDSKMQVVAGLSVQVFWPGAATARPLGMATLPID